MPSNFSKAVFHKIYLVNSWILCLTYFVVFLFHFSHENEKRTPCTVFRFWFFFENEKLKAKIEIQSKYTLSIKKLAIFWISIFIICVKKENKYNILNFVVQFIENLNFQVQFGYTDLRGLAIRLKMQLHFRYFSLNFAKFYKTDFYIPPLDEHFFAFFFKV